MRLDTADDMNSYQGYLGFAYGFEKTTDQINDKLGDAFANAISFHPPVSIYSKTLQRTILDFPKQSMELLRSYSFRHRIGRRGTLYPVMKYPFVNSQNSQKSGVVLYGLKIAGIKGICRESEDRFRP